MVVSLLIRLKFTEKILSLMVIVSCCGGQIRAEVVHGP